MTGVEGAVKACLPEADGITAAEAVDNEVYVVDEARTLAELDFIVVEDSERGYLLSEVGVSSC
jgi:hypothetical protein